MVIRISWVLILIIVALVIPAVSMGQPMGRGMYQGAPYGQYCPGMQWGPYGVRKQVRTAEEAGEAIKVYFSGNTQGIHVGKIEEKNLYFEAEILDRNNKIIDKTIIDKRSGRIRSIY